MRAVAVIIGTLAASSLLTLAGVSSIAQTLPPAAKPTLAYRVLVLNDKTGKPEKNWLVTEGLPQRGGQRTDDDGIAVVAHYEDNPTLREYVSEWSHAGFCPSRVFSITEILKSGIVASGICDDHSATAPKPTPGVLVLFARSLTVQERLRHWWAEHISPGT